ncbi:MAG: CHAT domain-containing protein [Hyphomicrobiales bacterium]
MLFSGARSLPTDRVSNCRLLHLTCHGHHDEQDAWESGFSFARDDPGMRLTGRAVACWRLATQLAVLQACSTRRQVTTGTEDGFGLGRFLHLAGVPSLLMTDWEVRSDVTSLFMDTFYERLRPELESPGPLRGYGAAYRQAVSTVRGHVGHARTFLWAPFSIIGAVR